MDDDADAIVDIATPGAFQAKVMPLTPLLINRREFLEVFTNLHGATASDTVAIACMPVAAFGYFMSSDTQLMDARELLVFMVACGCGSQNDICTALFDIFDSNCSNTLTPVRV